nr:laccase domain-containing protein [Micromonospora sp. DSM 115978]
MLDRRLGLPVQFMRQVHGAEVAMVREVGPPPVADALVTDVPGIALAVLVADCVPMTVTAPGVVAVVHAGRAVRQQPVADRQPVRVVALQDGCLHPSLGHGKASEFGGHRRAERLGRRRPGPAH